jgi:hypothetical protein
VCVCLIQALPNFVAGALSWALGCTGFKVTLWPFLDK